MSKKLVRWLGFTALLIILLVAVVGYQQTRPAKLEVVFFDVGQGDSILIKTPYHQKILIDGGPKTTVTAQLGRELAFGDQTIDAVVLTHYHADHMVGLIEVLKRYQVNKIFEPGVTGDKSLTAEWQRVINEKNIPNEVITGPRNLHLGPDCDLTFLYPDHDLRTEKHTDLNTTSVVSRLDCEHKSFMFTGDATQVEEARLVESGANIKADVLKVGHHGSKTSSSIEFLRAVQPQIAIISSGQGNFYGHPHKETLERLRQLGVTILRTDQLGTIRL